MELGGIYRIHTHSYQSHLNSNQINIKAYYNITNTYIMKTCLLAGAHIVYMVLYICVL